MNQAKEDDLLRTIYPQLRRFAAVVGPIEVSPDDRRQLEQLAERGPDVDPVVVIRLARDEAEAARPPRKDEYRPTT